jgi:Lon protease-like protein
VPVDALLPLFPLELVLLPNQKLPLHIFEPRYKEMIGECLAEKRPFGVVRVQDQAIAEIGCTAEILEITQTNKDGSLDIETTGRLPFEILELNHERSFLRAAVVMQEDEAEPPSPEDVSKALDLHVQVLKFLEPNESYEMPETGRRQLSYELASTLPLDLDFKQALLAMRSETDRLNALTEFYSQVLPKLELATKVREKAGGNGHIL